jgi:hypothetical protein
MVHLSGIRLAANEDGRLELMAIAEDFGEHVVYLWHRWERRGGGWSDWESFGPLGGASDAPQGQRPAVAREKSGSLVVAGVYAGEGHPAVSVARQKTPGRGWTGWFTFEQPAGHDATACVLGRNGNGRLEIFAADTDGMVWHTWQHGLGPWGWHHAEWSSLETPPRLADHAKPVVARNKDGQLELFLVDDGPAVWHWQRRESSWSRWKSLGTPGGQTPDTVPPPNLGRPVVARNKDGRLELFVHVDGGVWHSWQVHEHGWSAWELMGAPPHPVSELAVGAHADGRLVLFARTREEPSAPGIAPASSNRLYHREQTPGGSWSDWEEFPMTAEEHGVHVTLEHPALALNAEKRLELFTVIAGTTDLYWLSQTRPSGSQWRAQRVHLQAPPANQILTAAGIVLAPPHPVNIDTGQPGSQ